MIKLNTSGLRNWVNHITSLLIIYQLMCIISLWNFMGSNSIVLLKILMFCFFEAMGLTVSLKREGTGTRWTLSMRMLHESASSLSLHCSNFHYLRLIISLTSLAVACSMSYLLFTFTFRTFFRFDWCQCEWIFKLLWNWIWVKVIKRCWRSDLHVDIVL